MGIEYQPPGGTGSGTGGSVTIDGDSGSTEFSLPDTIIFAGGTNISTSMVGDTLTIEYTGAGGSVSINSLTDTTITSITSGELLKWNGSAWINNTLAEAGIAAATHTHNASDVNSGTFADARIAESNVTQHEAAISITESQISDFGSYADASHTHSTSDITSGTFADARIAESNVTQHESSITVTESQISDFGSYLTDITGEALSALSDVTLTSIASGEILKWNGSAWINNTLAEAGISASSHTHSTSDITSGTFADARIAESNITQHESALTVTESQISDLGSYITASSTNTLTNKTFDANGTGNSLSNVDVEDLSDGTDGELITWDSSGSPTTVSAGTSGQVLTSNGAGAAPTFQDAAGGGGASFFNVGVGQNIGNTGYNFYYYGSSPASSFSTSVIADRIYYIRGQFADDTYTRIGIEVTTAAAGTARLGIYEVDSEGSPGNLLLDAGTVDTSTTGVKEITISQTLSDGRYYLAAIFDASPNCYIGNNNAQDPTLGSVANNINVSEQVYKDSSSGEHTALSDPALTSLVNSYYVSGLLRIFLRKV